MGLEDQETQWGKEVPGKVSNYLELAVLSLNPYFNILVFLHSVLLYICIINVGIYVYVYISMSISIYMLVFD